MGVLFPLALAYAAGCISFAGLVARAHGVDLRSQGSGNPGATNVGRLLGPRWGRVVLALDMLKGFLPVWLLSLEPPLSASDWLVDPAGKSLLLACAVAGHVAPVTARFRGGKGVATFVGGLLAFDWALTLAAAATHLIARRAWGYVSLASVIMAWTVPAAQAACLAAGWRETGGVAVTAAVAALITLRHAANFGRIRAGTESRHGQRTRPESR
ncbi:MAG TPA: glycerol-3-phosphate acyltransferase [Planctomycetota bacterium]|nr:glycerol-3-phosphate acyltransferase [Planctomycetota bacterium]